MNSAWYVLHVKPRTEKKVVKWLGVLRAFRHLPTYVKVRKVQRRKVRVEMPLFPGYVFTRMDAGQRMAILLTNSIVRAIPVLHPRPMIRQLRMIARAARNASMPDSLSQSRSLFRAGDYVRVVAGPFYGLMGYIDSADSRLHLNLDILGRSVSVSISPDDVEPAKKAES